MNKIQIPITAEMRNTLLALPVFILVSAANCFRTSSTQNGWVHNSPAGGGNCRAAIVFLHGMGDDAASGWSALEHMLPSICPRLSTDNVHYSFPQAPVISVTLNGGKRISGWFDIMDWPIDDTTRDDPIGALKAVRLLEDTVETIEREEGIPAHRIVVGGFAQGAAVAMLSAYSRSNRGQESYAGCVCLSGWLPMRKRFKVPQTQTAEMTPLFWAHGLYDSQILIQQQVLGVQTLGNRGINVTTKTYPVGHESFDSQEIVEMAEFLDDTLFPKVDVESILPEELETAKFFASIKNVFDNVEDQLRP